MKYNVMPASKLSRTIREKISLGIIIIVWSSKFPARKNYTEAIFQACYIGRIARSSL